MPDTTLGLVEIAEDAVLRGLEQAARFLREELREIPAYRNLEEWLTAMARVEVRLDEMRLRLIRMRDRGLATREDFARYDLMRDNLYAMHQRADRLMRSVFGGYPQIVSNLPSLKKAPKVDPTPRAGVSGLHGQIWSIRDRAPVPAQGVAGHDYGRRQPVPNGGGFGDRFTALGNPAAAAAGLATWQWAAIVLLVLAAVVVVAIVVGGSIMSETIRDTTVNLAYLEKQAQVHLDRERCYESCIEGGASPDACAAQCINLHPLPQLARLPQPGSWVPWVAGAVITVTIVGALIYFTRRSRRRQLSGASRNRQPRHRQLSVDEFLSTDSNYGLEV